MKTVVFTLLTVIAGVLLYFGVRYLFPSHEDEIKNQLNSFSEMIQIEAEENPLKTAGKLNSLKKFVAPQAELIFQAAGTEIRIQGVDELQQKALQARPYFSRLFLSWKDLEFTRAPEDGLAELIVTAVVEGRTKNSIEDFLEASPFEIQFVHTEDGTWKISKMKNQKVLEFR